MSRTVFDFSNGKYWYVIHAPDTKIQDLVKKLKTVVGDNNVLFPLAKDRLLNRRKNVFIEKEYPLYFNYIFVKLSETNPDMEAYLQEKVNPRIKILRKPGSEEWSSLSEQEILNIKATMIEVRKEETTIAYTYQIGDKVKILIGPFKYFNGIVTELLPKKRTILVQVYMFSRATEVEIDDEGVELVE